MNKTGADDGRHGGRPSEYQKEKAHPKGGKSTFGRVFNVGATGRSPLRRPERAQQAAPLRVR